MHRSRPRRLRTATTTRLALLGLAALLFGPSLPAAVVDGKQVPLHQVSAEDCKDCHKQIYKQWKGSMHAQSTALKDPIHGALYRKLIGDPTKEGVVHKKMKTYPVCLKCHAPNAARDGNTKLDAMPAYAEGVTCVVCHSMEKYKGIKGPDGKFRLGASAYQFSDQLQGPNGVLHEQGAAADRLRAAIDDEGELNPHLGRDNDGKPYITAKEAADLDLPLAQNGLLRTNDACMGCHDKRHNPKGAVLCQTGDEFMKAGSKVTCQSCHMPAVKGLAGHSMGGGHDLGMLKRSVAFQVNTEKQGDKLKVRVSLKNQQPHDLPTGAPFRNMVVKVTALDRDGKVLWQNFREHPMKEDPQAYIVYVMIGPDGKPASPPAATGVGRNSRLKPFEKRMLEYDIPSGGVDSVRAELYYNLLWPGMVKQMKKLPAELKAPKLIAWSETRP